MNEYGRREAMQALGIFALAPLANVALPARAATPLAIAPQGQFHLFRQLRRGLSDGAAIVVTRRWRCSFTALDTGIAVTGEQLSVDVEAPAVLEPIAEIERKREVGGLFPALLDGRGHMESAALGTSQADLRRAIDEGIRIIEQHGVDAAGQSDARRFFAALANAGAEMVAKVPADLFFPAPGTRSESREITLPGGASGVFELTLSAEAESESGLLKAISRKVVTRAAGTQQDSSEEWFLRRS